MLVAVADTHAAIWYLFADSRLSPTAKSFMDAAVAGGDQIGISSISFVEIVYLSERGRIDTATFAGLRAKVERPYASFVEIPVDLRIAEVMQQIARAAIPEIGDRIIAATAVAANIPVITRDDSITKSSVPTIW
jgi:PIN domain nuclease of toxin-antitoxin system